jgi:hypothetical protein
MRKQLRVVLLAVLSAALLVAMARAGETRVAVLNPDRNLLNAVSVALSPWGLRVVPFQGTPPPQDPTAATESARRMAQAQVAGVVLWIAEPASGPPSLWMYDAQTEQLTVRPLPRAPPYDDAAAAATALTIKTVLRSTTAAPLQERTEPPTAATAATASTAPSTSPPPAPAPSTAASTTAPAPPAPSSPPAPDEQRAPAPPPPRHSWRVHLLALAQSPTGTNATLSARAGVAGSWWPSPWGEHLGLGLELLGGPNVDVVTPGFVGNFSDVAAGASARARAGNASLSAEVGAGPSLHFTSLSGTGVASGRSASVSRVDAAIDLEAAGDVALGTRVRVGPVFGTSLLLRYQRYSLRNDLVLRMPPVLLDFGGRVSIALD